VRSTEASCPFCSTALPSKLASRAVPTAPRRLGRLAAFTFAATVAVTGCVVSGAEDEDTGKSEDDLGGVMPMYGMPPPWIKDAGKDSGKDAGKDAAKDSGKDAAKDAGPGPCDDGGVYAMYGAPGWDPCTPPDDEDGGGIMPMYGMPAPEPK
jgi:hypothetical protein